MARLVENLEVELNTGAADMPRVRSALGMRRCSAVGRCDSDSDVMFSYRRQVMENAGEMLPLVHNTPIFPIFPFSAICCHRVISFHWLY